MKSAKWTKYTLAIFMVMLFNAPSIAQSEMGNAQEWKLIKAKKKGEAWQLYKQKIPYAKFDQVKIVGQINSSAIIAQKCSMSLFTDSSVYVSKKGKSLGWFKVFKQTEEEIELYSFMKGNLLYKDRDVVVRYQTYENSTGDTFGVKWNEIDKEGYQASDSIIRMPMDRGDWQFKTIDSAHCMAELSFQFNPGGSTPNWLINMIVKYYAPHELEYLRKLCKKEKQGSRH